MCVNLNYKGMFLMKIFKLNTSVYGIDGWGGRIRTYACSSQSAVSYRLTTPQCELVFNSDKGFGRVFAKALFCGVEDGTRTHGLQCHNSDFNVFLSIYGHFRHFLLEIKCSLNILFPPFALFPNLSMGYHVVVRTTL